MKYSSISEAIVAARKKHGLTQVEVASLCGTSQKTLSQLESGKVTVRTAVLTKVCLLLGLDLPLVTNPFLRGRAIKDKRGMLKLTLEDVSGVTDISIKHLSHIENGKENISLNLLIHLLSALGIDLFNTSSTLAGEIGIEHL